MRSKLRTPGEVTGELKLLENSLDRLRQSFKLEKDGALEKGIEALEKLREREKTHYTPRLRTILNDLRRLRYLAKRVEGVHSTIFLRLDNLEERAKESRAHVTGAVNRLIRTMDTETGEKECTD